MRTQVTLLTLIVALALSGGVAAFLLASPDDAAQPATAPRGFEQLSKDTIEAGIANAAAPPSTPPVRFS